MKSLISSTSLPPGVARLVALDRGIELRDNGDKCQCRCPFHDDKSASAFISISNNFFYCSVCTTGGGLSAKKFAEALGVDWRTMLATAFAETAQINRIAPPPIHPAALNGPLLGARPPQPGAPPAPPAPHSPPPASPFEPADAALTWKLASERVHGELSPEQCEADRPVYEFLRDRALGEAWESRTYGVLGADMALPAQIAWWPASGYRLVVPTFDAAANLVSIQGRAIVPKPNGKKVLFPKGSKVAGTCFANDHARRLLRAKSGEWHDASPAIVGEGLTDFLALCIALDTPVFSAPGAGMARHCIGHWASGRVVWLALDVDLAGQANLDVAAKTAYEFGAKLVRRIVWREPHKDACDALKAWGVERFSDFVRGQLDGVIP